ncbi:hypothetical protein [Haloarchaeobius sp. HRN-SO-5]|uniref:hypothetical protein n=1 Tax=Haloarchaeobius sp. HRN-SO-5 TaxID=3446118 RepID=UPI003EBA1D45
MGVRVSPIDPAELPVDATVRHYDELDEHVQTELAAMDGERGCVGVIEDPPGYVKFTRYYRVVDCSA